MAADARPHLRQSSGPRSHRRFHRPEACGTCHASQYDRQARGRHARALRPNLESPLPALLTGHAFDERNAASLEYAAAPGGVAVTARKSGGQGSALLEWAFGAGAQGITPVGRFEGRYLEHRLSWYEEPKRFAVTFGHPAREYGGALSALGLPQSDVVIYRCFHCHATEVELGASGPNLRRSAPASPASVATAPDGPTREAARAGRPKAEVARAILNPGRFQGKSQVEMCGECHRMPEPGEISPAPEILEPIAVRFQPIGSMASRCFLVSRKLSCLTCHDPHEDARPRSGGFYAARCLDCHKTAASVRSRCLRNKGQDCLPCHMRRTSPAPYLSFTDHRIRIY